MIAAAIPLLDRLKAEAEQADKAEDAYRREAAQRIKALEQERSFAYRRLNLLRAVAGAMAEATEEKEDSMGGCSVVGHCCSSTTGEGASKWMHQIRPNTLNQR